MIILSYLNSVRNRINQDHFIHVPSPVRNTVLLSSMGRSGSTWVASLLNYSNVYREMFEPFLPVRVPEANAFEYCQYVSPKNDDPSLHAAAKKILEGRVKRQPWIDSGNRKFISNKRLIKDIRTNLMLGWFRQVFPEMKIILLIRNPFSVIQSFIDLGWGIEPCGSRLEIEILLSQNQLMVDYPLIGENLEKVNLEDKFEALLFQWCILNYVPLCQKNRAYPMHLTFYENYLIDPRNELERLYHASGLSMDNGILGSLTKPSRTSYEKRKFSIDDIKFERSRLTRGLKILELFGLDNLYDHNFRPTQV